MEHTLRQMLGTELFQASKTHQVGIPLTERYPDISVEDAYNIQLHTIAQYTASGSTVTGKKIGLTSKAMQDLFGVYEPDFGSLLDHLAFDSGKSIPYGLLIQPKVEARLPLFSKMI